MSQRFELSPFSYAICWTGDVLQEIINASRLWARWPCKGAVCYQGVTHGVRYPISSSQLRQPCRSPRWYSCAPPLSWRSLMIMPWDQRMPSRAGVGLHDQHTPDHFLFSSLKRASVIFLKAKIDHSPVNHAQAVGHMCSKGSLCSAAHGTWNTGRHNKEIEPQSLPGK